MKKYLLTAVMLMLLTTSVYLSAQNKLTVDDRARFLSEEVETLLKGRLAADNLELTYVIDFKKKCDYWFASTYLQNDELYLSIKDCNDKTAGIKNLGMKIISASDSDKAMLLYFAIAEIINNPYKNVPQVSAQANVPSSAGESDEAPVYQTDPGQHKTRYFFAPTSYNLEKGDLYYNSLYFFLHDVQYGITDQFSLGMGTSIAGFPFYVTPKLTIPYNDKSSFAIGDILLLGTWNTDFFGNLLYGTYTYGDYRNNITVGGGHLYTRAGEITSTTNAPVVNFSALAQMSDHIYFITENYASQIKTKQDAFYNFYDPVNGYYDYRTENFDQDVFFIYGLTGFRFINRKKDVISWQVGLTYLFRSPEDIPVKYSVSTWNTSADSESRFITFPVIGYTRKFGVKY